jgi:hypothetical protein
MQKEREKKRKKNKISAPPSKKSNNVFKTRHASRPLCFGFGIAAIFRYCRYFPLKSSGAAGMHMTQWVLIQR